MLSANNKITPAQLRKLILADSLGMGVLFLPRRAAVFAGSDGWIAVIALTLVAVCAGALILRASRLIRGKGFIEGARKYLTLPGAYLVAVVFWAKLVICAGLELRIFSIITGDILLRETPPFVTAGAMLLACAYAAGKGIETRARLGEIVWPVMAAVLIFLFAAAVADLDFSNLKPVFTVPPDKILSGAFGMGYALAPLECLLLAGVYVSPSKEGTEDGKRKKNTKRGLLIAVALSGLIATLLTVVSLGMLGADGTASAEWPVLRLMDMIRLPGSIIERQDALMFCFQILSAFAVCGAYLFYSIDLLRSCLKKRPGRKSVVVPVVCALFVYAVSLIPLDPAQIEGLLDAIFMTAGILLMFALPLIIIALSFFKKRRALPVTVLFLFLLTGCWDGVAVENRDFATVIAIDKAEDSRGDRFSVSLAFPSIEKNGDKPTRVESAGVNILEETLEEMDAETDKQVYLGQAKILLLGKGLLSDKQLLDEAMRAIDGNADINRLMVTLSGDVKKTEKYADFLVDWFGHKNRPGGFTYGLTFSDAFETLRRGGTLVIPRVGTDGDTTRLGGGLLISDGKTQAELSESEMRGYLWGKSDGCVGAVAASALEVKEHKVHFSFDEDETLRCVMTVNLKGEGRRRGDDESVRTVKDEITETFNIARSGGADIFDLMKKLREENPALFEKYGEDTERALKEIKLEINIRLRG